MGAILEIIYYYKIGFCFLDVPPLDDMSEMLDQVKELSKPKQNHKVQKSQPQTTRVTEASADPGQVEREKQNKAANEAQKKAANEAQKKVTVLTDI